MARTIRPNHQAARTVRVLRTSVPKYHTRRFASRPIHDTARISAVLWAAAQSANTRDRRAHAIHPSTLADQSPLETPNTAQSRHSAQRTRSTTPTTPALIAARVVAAARASVPCAAPRAYGATPPYFRRDCVFQYRFVRSSGRPCHFLSVQ